MRVVLATAVLVTGGRAAVQAGAGTTETTKQSGTAAASYRITHNQSGRRLVGSISRACA
ncbi:hypothetical protein [Spongiactinospora gelatinilytica]|uniref:hypothetical protein n=1 Tax=Spongiactinospora gelatinilytica TaxID=2666298 RepID=UPI0013141292|nr:hypothetical protein [Spongiactinospora gelatinilytica]